MNAASRRAFTIIELLVVVSIIALLVSILLPAIGKARDQALVTQSLSNLRNLSAAHHRYSAEYKSRQLSLIVDSISVYGGDESSAFQGYREQHDEDHPHVWVGWGHLPDDPLGPHYHFYLASALLAMYQPISFTASAGSGGERFGSFRLMNAEPFHHYLTGRFYEPVLYAPKDEIALESVQPAFESPNEFYHLGYGNLQWTTYCMSPAAMFQPQVLRRVSEGGWQDPWSIAAGFKSPSIDQTLYPSLKTHVMEHHWLQGRREACNPAFEGGTYLDCEPYYFNHSRESVPMTVFYDGHVEGLGVREAMQADARMRNQTNDQDGLWSIDTSWGDDGYFISLGYDFAATSMHVFTTDGIRGRDMSSK
jgi:prepilin-type N-terminal cleavage/methylation domain-containing protein